MTETLSKDALVAAVHAEWQLIKEKSTFTSELGPINNPPFFFDLFEQCLDLGIMKLMKWKDLPKELAHLDDYVKREVSRLQQFKNIRGRRQIEEENSVWITGDQSRDSEITGQRNPRVELAAVFVDSSINLGVYLTSLFPGDIYATTMAKTPPALAMPWDEIPPHFGPIYPLPLMRYPWIGLWSSKPITAGPKFSPLPPLPLPKTPGEIHE